MLDLLARCLARIRPRPLNSSLNAIGGVIDHGAFRQACRHGAAARSLYEAGQVAHARAATRQAIRCLRAHVPRVRLTQARLLVAIGRDADAFALLRQPMGNYLSEGEVWAKIGKLLAPVNHAQAYRAFSNTLRLNPKHAEALLARRRLSVVAPPRRVEIEAMANGIREVCGLRSAPMHEGTAPITGGFSLNTVSLVRHDFRLGENHALSVVAKTFRVAPGDFPREITLTRAATAIAHEAGRFRFARYYTDIKIEPGRFMLCIEHVEDVRGSELEKARALGALAAFEPPAQFWHLVRERRTSGSRIDLNALAHRLGPVLGAETVDPLLAAIEQCRNDLEAMRPDYERLPAVLAHGDAQRPNLFLEADGTVVLLDIGGMLAAPAGYDLALYVTNIGKRRKLEALGWKRVERQRIAAFVEGYSEQGRQISVGDVRLGYAFGLERVLSRQCVRLLKSKVLSSESARLVSEDLSSEMATLGMQADQAMTMCWRISDNLRALDKTGPSQGGYRRASAAL